MSEDRGQLIAELSQRLENTPPLKDEQFITIETVTRYLKSTNWNIDEAEKCLLETLEWRRETNPKDSDCRWCHDRPGYHNMRQVGFDELGRPVIYACIAQATTRKYAADDIKAHVTYIMENAQKTMATGISTWTFVIDCTGMTLQACNPKLGYSVIQDLAKHYPERLGQVIVVKPNALFRAIWKPLKHFLDPSTLRKTKIVKKRDHVYDTFQMFFSDELSCWLSEEIDLNKNKPLPQAQREFWKAPQSGHDPRGCPSFIADYIEPFDDSKYKPHPNVVDSMKGKTLPVVLSELSLSDKDVAADDEDSDSEEMAEISEEFQIPDDAATPIKN